jgi:hypothetical protein
MPPRTLSVSSPLDHWPALTLHSRQALKEILPWHYLFLDSTPSLTLILLLGLPLRSFCLHSIQYFPNYHTTSFYIATAYECVWENGYNLEVDLGTSLSFSVSLWLFETKQSHFIKHLWRTQAASWWTSNSVFSSLMMGIVKYILQTQGPLAISEILIIYYLLTNILILLFSVIWKDCSSLPC